MSVRKQELPKHQSLQNTTCRIDSIRKEMNIKKFDKTGSLVDKSLCCPPVQLSTSKILIFDVVETGFLPLDFAQQLRRKNADVPDIYFALVDATGIFPALILK